MTKVIAIYFSDPGLMDYPFTKEYYFEIYQQIIAAIEARGPRVYIVRAGAYQGNGLFTTSSRVENGQVVPSGAITANLIFNRDDKNTIPRIIDCPIINHPSLDELCLDKVATAKLFPNFSPLTAGINSYQQYQNTLAAWAVPPKTLLVLKKNFQTEGRGIFFLPANQVLPDCYDDWSNILMQEFMESALGIPGVAKGRHDLRINVVNNTPINAYVREPPQGSYLANVAQGGSGRSVELSNVPPVVLEHVEAIIKKLAQYAPSIFAADFMNSAKGFRLVEMNSRPMVQHYKWFSSYQKFNQAIVDMLVAAVG